MQITIELSIEDLRIAKSVAQNQTHFVINSECIEDAVITGILQQINTVTPDQRTADGFDIELKRTEMQFIGRD
jgi:hypothetical protein